MALSGRIKGESFRVFALLSDGENNEGSVWEAAMFAAAQKLENVCVIVDYNKWQATARSNETLMLAPLRDKWAAFGWDAHEIDGHDVGALAEAMQHVPNGSGKPVALIAHTVKGKGVSFMEDDNNWHYRAPTAEEVVKAHKELGLVMRNAFADELTKLGNEDARVVMLSGDIGNRLFDKFKDKHPVALLQLRRGGSQHDGRGRRHGDERPASGRLHHHARS